MTVCAVVLKGEERSSSVGTSSSTVHHAATFVGTDGVVPMSALSLTAGVKEHSRHEGQHSVLGCVVQEFFGSFQEEVEGG